MKQRDLKLCVFLSDPMSRLYIKGEIKARYYNPDNLFSRVHMISFSDADIAAEKVQTTVGDAKLEIHCVGKPNFFNLALIFRRISLLIKKIGPDLLRAYDISLRGALVCYFAKKVRTPCVISIHNNFEEQRKYDKRPILQLRRLFERYALINCDTLICVSQTLKRYAQKYRTRTIRVIYNRVDLNRFASFKENNLQDHSPFKLLSVARLVAQKNQECLIRAIKDLDVRLTLIGSGPKHSQLSRMAGALGIREKLEFIPSVPHSQIEKYYHQADLFILSSHYEGFCIPIIEAMAAGLPIVASNLEVISELVNGSACLCKNNPDDFKKTIELLMDNRQLRAELGKKARERAALFNSTGLELQERKSCEELLNTMDRERR